MAAREYRTGTGAYLASASAGVTEALTLSVNAEVRDGVVRQQWYSAGGLDEHQSDCWGHEVRPQHCTRLILTKKLQRWVEFHLRQSTHIDQYSIDHFTLFTSSLDGQTQLRIERST